MGTRDLWTLWSPPVSLNQERHTQRHKAIFFFFYCFWKLPHEIYCWLTSLLQHFSSLNSLSPKGSVLFTVPSSKQLLPSKAKQATYTTHLAQHSSSRPRSARAGNQRTTMPAPLVLGTRERPCPFHPCRGPKSRPAFCDGPASAPPTTSPVGGNPGVRECRAGPGRPSVTDSSSVTNVVNL
jgi:hypothetical protein